MSTQTKIIAVMGAIGAAALLTYLYRRRSPPIKETQVTPANKSKGADNAKQTDVKPEDLQKAQKLKDEGNKAFKEGNFEEAIRLYSEAIACCTSDTHLLYSNRSAAFMALNMFQDALNDGFKCTEVNPAWSKGYFRIGKAFLAQEKFDEAFMNFYKGLLLDPKSDEIKKNVDLAKQQLGPGELDPRVIIDTNVTKQHMQNRNEDICKNILQVDFETIQKIIQQALDDNQFDQLLENETLAKCIENHPVATFLLITQTLLEEGKSEPASVFIEKAYQREPENAQVLLMYTTTLLKLRADYSRALDMVREALKHQTDDVLIAHTYAAITLHLYQLIGTPAIGVDVPTLLKELKVGLENPNTNHLLIADAGIRLWFKFFEDPEIGQKLMQEENENQMKGLSMEEAYIKGLVSGVFQRICLEPFFMESLSKIVFNNPGLEKVLNPFRTAFFKVETVEVFDKIAPFLYAMALQCFRNNYSWSTRLEDKKLIRRLNREVTEKLQTTDPSALVVNGTPEPDFLRQIAILSLFKPLGQVEGIEPVIKLIDLNKVHPWFAAMIKKSVLAPAEEREIEIVSLTAISDGHITNFYNSHLSNTWDSAGLQAGKLTRITLKDELKWLFKYEPQGFDGVNKVLIAGCGSGNEVYQFYSTYNNIEVTGVDTNAANIAYAIRQNKELGVTTANFFHADIMKLEPTDFPQLFDVVVANAILHNFPDPLKAWGRLVNLIRPGGVMKVSLYSNKFIKLLSDARRYLSNKFSPAIFENSPNGLPSVVRVPTEDEIRTARQYLFDSEDQNLEDLLLCPAAYTLNEFTTLLFHPQVLGFTFKTIGECLKRLNLDLIGFEFQGIQQDTILSYRVEYPNDPFLKDCESLQAFEERNPDIFKNYFHLIQFTCAKKA